MRFGQLLGLIASRLVQPFTDHLSVDVRKSIGVVVALTVVAGGLARAELQRNTNNATGQVRNALKQ